MVDVKTLEILIARMRDDTRHGHGLNAGAVASIADIIEASIGAPLSWPSRVAGVYFANDYYPGSNEARLGFNHGVKWAVEHYAATMPIKLRFG
jgi:hypothetical protein